MQYRIVAVPIEPGKGKPGQMPPVIDSHALIFARDVTRYPFSPQVAPVEQADLAACTEIGALETAIRSGRITGAVLVQRNRFYGFDNSLVCDLAAGNPRLRALVSIDTRMPGAPREAARLLALPGIAGLRLMEPSKDGNLEWLEGEHARASWACAADLGRIVDVHLFPWNRDSGLAALGSMMKAFPEVSVVLDNLGNGPIEAASPGHEVDANLAELLDRPNLMLKFSAMTLGRIERAGGDPAETIELIARRVGPTRLTWGSDLLPPGQALPAAAARAGAAAARLSPVDQAAILSGNAARLFGLTALPERTPRPERQ